MHPRFTYPIYSRCHLRRMPAGRAASQSRNTSVTSCADRPLLSPSADEHRPLRHQGGAGGVQFAGGGGIEPKPDDRQHDVRRDRVGRAHVQCEQLTQDIEHQADRVLQCTTGPTLAGERRARVFFKTSGHASAVPPRNDGTCHATLSESIIPLRTTKCAVSEKPVMPPFAPTSMVPSIWPVRRSRRL